MNDVIANSEFTAADDVHTVPLSTSPISTSSRRKISLLEAVQIAEGIQRRAEEGRRRAVIDEANRQFDLEPDE